MASRSGNSWTPDPPQGEATCNHEPLTLAEPRLAQRGRPIGCACVKDRGFDVRASFHQAAQGAGLTSRTERPIFWITAYVFLCGGSYTGPWLV